MKEFTKVAPFHIIGNVYFVGCKECSSHLFVTEEGLILLDTGCEEVAPLIVESITALGFRVEDIKIILHSHGHYDHTWATPALLALAPEAKTYLCSLDERYLEHRFVPDFDYEDGGEIRLGSTVITTLFTPGHTEGSYSFFLTVNDNGKNYRLGMFGGAGPRQLKKDYMNHPGHDIWYCMRGKFFDSIERLLCEHVDVMLGNHTWHNNTLEKAALAESGAESNPFIRPEEWREFLTSSHEALWKIIREESRTHFVNYAHRGAPSYCPENTFLSFYTGILMGANGIETDVQKTKDGVLVLFHDNTLTRVTGAEGAVCDYTYEELSELLVKGHGLTDKIPTLEDFLSHFAHRDITFALELKADDCEAELADLIYQYEIEGKCIVTSFDIERIRNIKAYAPTLRVGYLAKSFDEDTIDDLLGMCADEICPHGKDLSAEDVQKYHRLGFNVRAWGIENEEIMRAVYNAGADGMTVNFPNKLTAYIKEKTQE